MNTKVPDLMLKHKSFVFAAVARHEDRACLFSKNSELEASNLSSVCRRFFRCFRTVATNENQLKVLRRQVTT